MKWVVEVDWTDRTRDGAGFRTTTARVAVLEETATGAEWLAVALAAATRPEGMPVGSRIVDWP